MIILRLKTARLTPNFWVSKNDPTDNPAGIRYPRNILIMKRRGHSMQVLQQKYSLKMYNIVSLQLAIITSAVIHTLLSAMEI